MTAILIALASVIAVGFFGCIITAIVRSLGGQARDDEAYGAPEGVLHFQNQLPSATGSKLSVRDALQSVSQDAG